ncbi:MAG: hypothetical protein AB7V42_16290 [Thermoleophilia bacterium]
MTDGDRWQEEEDGVVMRYDPGADSYHCAFGPSSRIVQVEDAEREVIVRVDAQTRLVVGFTIPGFRAWHARHADADGDFELDLPTTWEGPLAGI